MKYLPYDANDTPPDGVGALYLEKLVESFLLLLFPQDTEHEIKEAVEKDDNQNEHVAIVLGLVNGDDEAVSLHDQGQHQEQSH